MGHRQEESVGEHLLKVLGWSAGAKCWMHGVQRAHRSRIM